MADFYPLRSSSPREPDKKPRPIPPHVKAVIHLMIWGDDANPAALPLDLIAACAATGVKPFVMRRYLDRPAVIAHLRAEHRKFREVVCCGNTAALKKVRDRSENGMAVVASCRALDGSQADDAARAPGVLEARGITLRIIQAPRPEPIDITPKPSQIVAGGEPD
jgi:hypothetical protein